MRLRSITPCQRVVRCAHTVHFYDHAFPADAASRFIAAGLLAGQACVVMLTATHRRAVEQQLRAQGLRVGAGACDHGSYRSIDSDATLAALQVGGRLDLARAHVLLESVLAAPPGRRGQRVRVVGSPAPALLAAGQADDAVAFEAIVDRLAEAHGAEVFCAYPVADFCRQGRTRSLFEVCAEHRSLTFPDRLWVQSLMAAEPGPRALRAVA